MKPIIELVKRKEGVVGDDVALYACGKCGRLCSPGIYYASAENAHKAAIEMAEMCCEPVKCDCGKLVERKYRTACNDCIARIVQSKYAEKQAKAQKFTLQERGANPMCYDDEYFTDDIDQMLDHLRDLELDKDRYPLDVWLCDEAKPELDYDRIMENFHERLDMGSEQDVEDFCRGIPALKQAIVDFNAKQTETIWTPGTWGYIEIQYTDVHDDDVPSKEAP